MINEKQNSLKTFSINSSDLQNKTLNSHLEITAEMSISILFEKALSKKGITPQDIEQHEKETAYKDIVKEVKQ